MSKTTKSARPERKVGPLEKLVSDNIHKLLGIDGRDKTPVATLRAEGLSNGTAGRLVTPDGTSIRLEFLAAAAKALHVQPWHLLLPDLQTTTSGGVVSVEGMRARQWPFPTLKREEVETLTPLEMERLERTMRARISELLEDRPHRPPDTKQAGGE